MLSHKISWFIDAVKDRLFPRKYTPEEYWQKRLSKNLNLIGVGNKRFTEEQNRQLYDEKKGVLSKLLQKENIDLGTKKILEIGCGTGYWTEMCSRSGCADYTGIDIAQVTIDDLRVKYPNYSFICGNAADISVEGPFPLILMIDVTQHIVDDEIFFGTMEMIKKNLKADGIFIVTSWLELGKRNSYYEKSRDINYYKKAFPDYNFSNPEPFADKYIFTIKSSG